ncbi:MULTISPECIES: N5-glutamine methyltransferase family protein [unclassified Halobacteriovorax]|uniref:N5-glutamine methyltransferase family protein n=1 Tax=unclassified Halobacteriovorax TaxID=2639665 RepID=UPI002FF0D98E
MSFTTLGDYISSFYNENKQFLEANYPGISLGRLKLELKNFCRILDSQFDDIYISENKGVIEEFLKKVKQGIPLEYISNRSFFYRSSFYINENVLIPRSETEIMVEWTAEYIRKNRLDHIKIADIGTGSGAIALSLAGEIGEIDAEIIASDISEKALDVARANKFFHRYRYPKTVKLKFQQSDRMENIPGDLDIIITNPPYIKENADLSEVHGQVHSFEPHLALYLKDQDYDNWFKTFFDQAQKKLKNGGLFIMEGSELHLERLKDILGEYNFGELELIKDYTDRYRFLKGRKNG